MGTKRCSLLVLRAICLLRERRLGTRQRACNTCLIATRDTSSPTHFSCFERFCMVVAKSAWLQTWRFRQQTCCIIFCSVTGLYSK